jgi:hypothetical protein
MKLELLALVLLVFGVLMILFTIWERRKGRLSRGGVVVWLLIWLLIVVSTAYPPIYEFATAFLQVGLPVHLVTICAIFILFLLVHRLYVKISELDRNLTRVVQRIALYGADEEKKKPK